MFLDGISAVVLTMAIIEPMIRQAGFDMIWFGIYLVIVVEMAQITPPVGFNLFVLQRMAKRDMGFIFFLMILAVKRFSTFSFLNNDFGGNYNYSCFSTISSLVA